MGASEEHPLPQLQMIWPIGRPRPVIGPLPVGYELRHLTDADTADWIAVMTRAGFEDWTAERLAETATTILPDGAFVVVVDERIVATTFAQRKSIPTHPDGGEVGWVAADPDHRGKGLGKVLVAAATGRLIAAGFGDIFLLTDDWRLPAIRVYLDLGFQPHITHETHPARWRTVREQLGLSE